MDPEDMDQEMSNAARNDYAAWLRAQADQRYAQGVEAVMAQLYPLTVPMRVPEAGRMVLRYRKPTLEECARLDLVTFARVLSYPALDPVRIAPGNKSILWGLIDHYRNSVGAPPTSTMLGGDT